MGVSGRAMVIPAVRISAARSSILPISWRGLLPGAILKRLRRWERSDLTPVVWGPYHARSASRASLSEVHLCKMLLPLLPFKTVDRRLHASACMSILSRLYPFRQVPSFWYPIPPRHCTGVDPTQKQIGNPPLSRSTWRLLVQAMNSGFFPLNCREAVCLTLSSLERGISCPTPNSPPGYDPHSPAPLG